MTMKRVFLTLLAALLLPGLALAQTTTRATFTVQKVFHDGNSDTDVTVNIQCFTGVPLNQSQTVNPDNGGEFEVEFVVESFQDGELDCDVWEDPVSGYSADYYIEEDNAESITDEDDACEFEDVSSGGDDDVQNVCEITNFPDYQTVTINKDWVIEGSGGDSLDPKYKLELVCEGPDFRGEHPGIISGGKYYKGYWHKWFKNYSGTDNEEYSAEVLPDWKEGTECWVNEKVYDSSIEVTNGCGGEGALEVSIGAGDECTITNTVFYEGIPTLSQYGMAILALLMLGMGFVGFRRFV
jgi:IPTL-CTERM motif